jgi:hypothetical protein
MTTKKPAKGSGKAKCVCPFCEVELPSGEVLLCKSCNVVLDTCPSCKKTVPKKASKCPECGASLK